MRHGRALRAAHDREVSTNNHRAVERCRVRACHTIRGADYRGSARRRRGADQSMSFR